MRALEDEGVTAYIEIGPQPVLVGMGRQCVTDEGRVQWLPSLRRDADSWRTLLGSAGRLSIDGVKLDWTAFDAPYARRRVSVPSYAFGGKSYWLDQCAAPAAAGADSASGAVVARQKRPAVEAYEVAWREIPLTRTQNTSVKQCVVFVDQRGVARELIRVLRRRGVRCIAVDKGSQYARVEQDKFEIAPANPEHLDDLYKALAPGDGLCTVDLSALDLPVDGLALETLKWQVPAAVQRAADLVRTLASADRPTSVWFVTRGVAPAGHAEEPTSLAQAPLWGFARSVSLEHPDLGGGLIDLSRVSADNEIESLADVVLSDGSEPQVALRGLVRYAPRLVAATGGTDRTASFDPKGTYLVTGGTGALGLQVAKWLVSKGVRHLVLTSRQGTVDARGAALVMAMEKAGARVEMIGADVARSQDVDRLLAAIAAGPAPLRGVIHAAGVDVVVPIRNMTSADVEQVLAPKVTGAWLLHERTRLMDLETFVCFSSMASVVGAQGRAHYGGANAFLDALACERHRLGLPITSVNWGPWAGGGMATDAHLTQLERIGNYGLSADDALRAFDSLKGRGTVSAMVAQIDWSRFRRVYEGSPQRALFCELTDAPPAVAPAHSGFDWVARLAAVPAAQRPAEIMTLLSQAVADTLGFDDVARVPRDRSLYEIGMDSLMMAELVSRLKRLTGMASTSLVFDYPTVESLAPRLLDMLSLPENASPDSRRDPAAAADESSWLSRGLAYRYSQRGQRGAGLQGRRRDSARSAVLRYRDGLAGRGRTGGEAAHAIGHPVLRVDLRPPVGRGVGRPSGWPATVDVHERRAVAPQPVRGGRGRGAARGPRSLRARRRGRDHRVPGQSLSRSLRDASCRALAVGVR
jgi:NAD(P)-dependent dehydrogenase (short-subunit alcohol dehydrogenase family)/acyl carrier protein